MNSTRLKELCEVNSSLIGSKKIKVSPHGDVAGFDGRSYKIDAASLVASIHKNSLDIPLDENHSYGKAIGWFSHKSFEVREDGIYAELTLNSDGKALIENRSYRYLSPVFALAQNRSVVGLDSIGLVNRPNLLTNALNSKENQNRQKENRMEVQEKTEKSAETKLLEANAKIEQLEQNIKSMQKSLRIQKVESAIKSGELMANKRDFALSLDDDKQLEAFLEVSKSDMEHLRKPLAYEQNSIASNIEESAEFKNIAAQLGI